MAKSAVFGVMHLGIAFAISYALTGSLTIAGAITLIEPLVNTVAHYFFDRWWGHPRLTAWWQARTLKSVPLPKLAPTRAAPQGI